jgi:hypothetical protein
MAEVKRSYRKNLTSFGLIYLGRKELEISVRNLSITGLLAEVEDNAAISNIKDVFQSIKLSPTIDIYLEEMRIAGEAEIVRADMIDGQVYLAIEFRNVYHNVEDVLYKRKAYRKNMTAPGKIIFNKKKYTFNTKNVSVDGLMIHLKEKLEIESGTITIFDFKRLQLRGEIKVMWVEHCEDDSTLMGLQYLHMEKEDMKGVPRFAPRVSEEAVTF